MADCAAGALDGNGHKVEQGGGVKRSTLVRRGGSRGFAKGAAAAAAALAVWAGAAGAQSGSCNYDCDGDTLALRAPQGLHIRFERRSVQGNLLTWTPLPDSVGTCASIRSLRNPPVLPPFNPVLEGAYRDLVDRQLKFAAEGAGTIGDPTQSTLVISWNNMDSQPGRISGALTGKINVSDSGGLFLVATGTAQAQQVNNGIPPYLFPHTNVRALATWKSPDARASRVYAAVTGNSGTMLARADVRASDTAIAWTIALDPKLPGAPVQASFAPVALAVSPGNPDLVLLGSTNDGVHRSNDGGVHWSKLVVDATLPSQSAIQQVSFLGYAGGTSFACLRGLGLFRSSDDGSTWTRLTLQEFHVPIVVNGVVCPNDTTRRTPIVTTMVADPTNPSQLYAGLQTWGVYKSADGGLTWARANQGMVECPSLGFSNGRAAEPTAIMVDATAPNVLLAGTTSRGLFRTVDFGNVWTNISAGLPDSSAALPSILQDAADPSVIYAATETRGLIRSVNGGAGWDPWGSGLTNSDLTKMVWHPEQPGVLLLGTENGGVYRAGTAVLLSRTYRPPPDTDPDKLGLELGLKVRFDDGPVAPDDSLFVVRAQTYQGYTVWRSRTPRPDTMQLIGLYDRTNPESCFADPCDAQFPRRIPGCFADKRAACFTFFGRDSVSFFDRDIYNGFTYYYAVSTFDYGYSGNVFPTSLAREMTFSPRGADENSPQSEPFLGCSPVPGAVNSNQTKFQVNLDPANDLKGVFVVPNPLRRQGGWDVGDQSTLRFFNVTPGAKCEIFTVAGDLVRQLANVTAGGAARGNIEWDTRNESGESVASGVYIYRITNSAGEELFGRLTIIR